MKLARICLLTVVFSLFLAVAVRGDTMVFEFGNAGSSPESNFQILNVGDTVDVEVYLRELDGGTVLATEELFSSAVGLSFDSSVVQVQAVSNIFANSAFDDVFPTVGTGEASLTVAAFFNPLVLPDAENRILLGTFRFTGVAAGSSSVTAGDLNPGFDETLTGAFTPLDDLITPGFATIHVQGAPEVPEPNALVLLVSAACLLIPAARKRLFKRPAEVV